jgi:uncharacterized membrane protein YcaP (DUF421 family)
MPAWLNLDWYTMFVPSKPILETVVRGSVTYLALFVLLRLFRRQTGSVGPADLLVLLLIADASQNAMASEYRAITDGLILVATIVAWEYALDWLAYHVPAVGRWIERSPLALIDNGKVHRKNLESELISEDELLSQLRQKGVDDVAKVKRSFLESDGHVSVITDNESTPQQSSSREKASAG